MQTSSNYNRNHRKLVLNSDNEELQLMCDAFTLLKSDHSLRLKISYLEVVSLTSEIKRTFSHLS